MSTQLDSNMIKIRTRFKAASRGVKWRGLGEYIPQIHYLFFIVGTKNPEINISTYKRNFSLF